MDTFLSDLRHGARLLIKSPASSVVSVLALSLGIGLTTTMFSIVYGALFRGLPFEEADRIMNVGYPNAPMRLRDYHAYAQQQQSFESLAAYQPINTSVSGSERADQYEAVRVTSNFFEILRVQPVFGRSFRPEEGTVTAQPVGIIAHSLWQSRFDADPQILGRSMRVNGRPTVIVGVMPEGFRFPSREQIWLPLDVDPLAASAAEDVYAEVFGRLRAGVSAEDAAARLSATAERLEQEYATTNRDLRPTVIPMIDAWVGGEPRALLLTMLGAVFFVLLIACTNVANLLLSRALLRHKEVGIRSALGASRARIVSQFLTEAILLSVIGSLLGAGIALAGITVFNAALVPAYMPYWMVIKLDAAAVVLVVGLTLVTTLITGAIPALQAARSHVSDVLKDEARGSSSFRLGRLSRSLVAFEIALSCALLVAAGLTIKSIVKLRTVDLGFDTENLLTGLVTIQQPTDAESAVPALIERFSDQLARVPALTSVTFASSIPGLGGFNTMFAVEGNRYERDQDYPQVMHVNISPSFLETLGVSMVEGRNITASDRAGTLPVVLVNQGFARKHFPGQPAIGRRIRMGNSQSSEAWLTIVGIVPDIRFGELAGFNETEAILLPLAQQPISTLFVIARTQGAPIAATAALRNAIAAVDPDVPLYRMNTLTGWIRDDTWFYSVFGLFMVFGAAALFLAALGLYAVMAFSVSQRTREVGIRMAIGAQTGHVLRMILRQGLAQISVGMVLGLALAAALSQLLAVILFDVDARDPGIFGGVVLMLTASALLACIVPARRATRIDPLEALRHE